MMHTLNSTKPAITQCLACLAAITLLVGIAKADDARPRGKSRILLKGAITSNEEVQLETVRVQARYVHFQPRFASGEVDQTDEELPSEFVVYPNGKFRFERKRQPMRLYCESADGKLAGTVQISDETSETQIELRPLATVRGRLIDLETDNVMPDERILVGLHFDSNGQFVLDGGLLGGHGVTTNENGQFEFSNLVANQTYDLQRLHITKERTLVTYPLGTFETDASSTIDLGNVDLSRSSFVADIAATTRLSDKLLEGRLSNQHVLLVFSSAGDESFRSFFKLRENDEEVSDAMHNFLTLIVECKGKSAAGAVALARKLNIHLPSDSNGACFCFLNESGDVAQEIEVKGIKEHPFPKRAFLEAASANSPKIYDAHELLESALKQANAEHKLLLIQETGPNCGPCILMSQFLESTREYWADDFVWLKLDDRWRGTIEITTALKNNKTSSIPWYGLLDSDRTLLFTSVDPDGKNMGFPGSDRSKKHFRKMIEDHTQHMTESSISGMLQELEK